MSLDDFGKRLSTCLGQRIARRHAVAYIEVADNVDREPDTRSVALADEGQGTDAAINIPGIVFNEYV